MEKSQIVTLIIALKQLFIDKVAMVTGLIPANGDQCSGNIFYQPRSTITTKSQYPRLLQGGLS